MLNNRKIFLVLFLFLAACTSPAPKVEGENWVAFSADKAKADQVLDWLFPGDVEYWSPTATDIQTVEDGIAIYLQENADAFYPPQASVWDSLDEYNRQYVGVLLDDRKVIYANFFCNTSQDWKQEFVMVLDGGACYFQFKFDVQTDRYFDLQVNEEA